ncbi:MAG: hypothetical protein PHQ40_11895 [Anaerolineaceae bacterium]|nr:hypothetical protein [Anaerolineaceae bacterium]
MAQDFTTPPEPGPVQEYPVPAPVPPPLPPKKNNTTLIIIIVLAVVLLCCCCLAVFGYLAWKNGDTWFNFELPSTLAPLLLSFV